MKSLISYLKEFNFSETEANIYITLLKHGELNGSQISKILACSRSAVYDYLTQLQERGAITLIDGDIKIYSAKPPEILMEELKQSYIQNAEYLKNELKQLSKNDTCLKFWNIQGNKSAALKAKELINSAQSEIYINATYQLKEFETELRAASERGVRIIFFSFTIQEKSFDFIEYYYNDIKDLCMEVRLILVIDNKSSLIASKPLDSAEEMTGTYTSNHLMVKILAEHIHHDIYLRNLEKKYGKVLVDDSITINSGLERDTKDEIEELRKRREHKTEGVK